VRVYIIDDEEYCLDDLKWRLHKYPDIEIIGAFTDPNEALASAGRNRPDAVFLDIDMPKLSGLELALKIQAECPGIIVIFVTAYAQYALEAFRAFPLDFLLKPAKEARMDETIRHMREQYALLRPAAQEGSLKINCFGPFMLTAGHEVKWGTRRVRELFLYLLDRRGAAPSREEILNAVFNGQPDKNAVHNLYMTIYRLRNLLLEMDAEGKSIRMADDYSLTVAPGVCDYTDFMGFARDNPVISGKNAVQAARALNLYKGSYLENECFQWACETSHETETEYERIALALAGYHGLAGRVPEADSVLNALLARNPMSADGYAALLDLYMENRNRLAFCERYEQYVRMLKTEFRVRPQEKYRHYFDLVKGMK